VRFPHSLFSSVAERFQSPASIPSPSRTLIRNMPAITAVLHTENDGLRLGRALETLYPCDDIFVIDHDSRDATISVARHYGARVIDGRKSSSPENWPAPVDQGWIFCLDPKESLTENLAASLYEWKFQKSVLGAAFSMFLREETSEGWREVPLPQTRLVPASWKEWNGVFPGDDRSALPLEGELLRFSFP
jgi:hypothetical protein